jgi:predicted O-methyltransferase YrrM
MPDFYEAKVMQLHFSAAAERNQGPILQIIAQELANTRRVLEIGSGTGQHAVYFAERLPHRMCSRAGATAEIAFDGRSRDACQQSIARLEAQYCA